MFRRFISGLLLFLGAPAVGMLGIEEVGGRLCCVQISEEVAAYEDSRYFRVLLMAFEANRSRQ